MVFTHIESLRARMYECENILRLATANANQAKDIQKRAQQDYLQVQRELVAALEAEVAALPKDNK